jgi:hypothetical protein
MINIDLVLETISSIKEDDLDLEITKHEDQLSKLRSLRQRLFPKPLPEVRVTIPTSIAQEEEQELHKDRSNSSKDVQTILNARIEEGKRLIKEENELKEKDPVPEPVKEFGDLKKVFKTNQPLPLAITLANFFIKNGPQTLGIIAMKICKKAVMLDKFLRSHEWFELDSPTHKWSLSQAGYTDKEKWHI